MNFLISVISILVIGFLLIKMIKKKRDKSESQLSVFEHPSTFKKPDIEMVSKTLGESGSNENLKTIHIDNLSQEIEKE